MKGNTCNEEFDLEAWKDGLQRIVFDLTEQLGIVSFKLIRYYEDDENLRERMMKIEKYNNMLREALEMSTV